MPSDLPAESYTVTLQVTNGYWDAMCGMIGDLIRSGHIVTWSLQDPPFVVYLES